jgi:Ca2+-binding EF-hand superfamily protein
MFRRMDDDGSRSLSFSEFSKGIIETGLVLEPEDMQSLFRAFDADESGFINIDEFLLAVRVRHDLKLRP